MDGIKSDQLSQYFAHFDQYAFSNQTLSDHLFSVSRIIIEQINNRELFDPLFSEAADKIGLFHDIGKYTDAFQNYLLNNIITDNKEHSGISACFTYNILEKLLFNTNINSEPNIISTKNMILFFSYLVVALHHGDLTTKEEIIYNNRLNRCGYASKNLVSNSEKIINNLKAVYSLSIGDFISLVNADNIKNNILLQKIPAYFHTGRNKDSKWYFMLIYLFSLLIDADKLDSAELSYYKNKRLNPNIISDYLLTKEHGKNYAYNTDREAARAEITGNIYSLDKSEIETTMFFTLTAPTGIGKTLSSLQAAMILQKKIESSLNYIPKIITAIPFINIIEQTRKDYEKVISMEESKRRLIIHHRLSDYISSEDGEKTLNQNQIERESWNSDVVLTTYVQLFQSMLTSKNRMLKKINKLAGSIVILDEIQAIPDKYLCLLGAMLIKIAQFYKTRFILMSATQPKILDFGNLLVKEESLKIKNILPNNERYYKNLSRTKLIPLIQDSIDLDGFLKLFFQKWIQTKSCLIVVNTIQRSIEVYNKIKETFESEGIENPLKYLSTNIYPKKRREVIKETSEMLTKKVPVILVSTQTIEAGVDLDFDMGFRDIAPLDSLIQTAGRINRVGEKGTHNPVFIVRLENDNQYIYDLQNRKRTMDLLISKPEIHEKEYFSLAESYYLSLLQFPDIETSRDIWENGILRLDFDKINEFQLIKKLDEVGEVFIEGDEEATSIANEYSSLYKTIYIEKKRCDNKTKFEQRATLKEISRLLDDYIIQVRTKKLRNNPLPRFTDSRDGYGDLHWVPPDIEQQKHFYDIVTGFISSDGSAHIY